MHDVEYNRWPIGGHTSSYIGLFTDNAYWVTYTQVYTKCSIHFVRLTLQDIVEEKDVAEDASLKTVKYARTPIMSTYLVAFVVGEFDFVEGKDADGVKIRVYTPKGKAVQGQFALEVSTGCTCKRPAHA